MIGTNIFIKYSNIVFDFTNNIIQFDSNLESYNEVQMYVKNGFVYIPVTFLSENFDFCIDTGTNLSSIAKDFELDRLKLEKANLYKANSCKLDDLDLGKVYFSCGADNITTNVWAQNFRNNTNVLGTPPFLGHIIQLDFENNVFRIK